MSGTFKYRTETLYHKELVDARASVKIATEIFPNATAEIRRVPDGEVVEKWRYDSRRHTWIITKEEENDEGNDDANVQPSGR